MTVEELKAIAAKMGYRIIKQEPLPEMKACTCGCTVANLWNGPGYKYYKCVRCGHKGGHAKTIRKAIEAWNVSFEKEENME